MPDVRERFEFDEDTERAIRARVKAGLNTLTAGQGQYLLDQMDAARDCEDEWRGIAMRSAEVDAMDMRNLRETIARVRESVDEGRTDARDDRTAIASLTVRMGWMEVELEGRLTEAAAVLRWYAEKFGGVDSGYCRECGSGNREYDLGGSPRACENEGCVSHRTTAVLEGQK